jgi:hypothetical protein
MLLLTVQVLPLNVSVRLSQSEPFSSSPTATQLDVLAQETPSMKLKDLLGFGLATTDHVVPFHDSMRVSSAPEVLTSSPTATQWVEVVHDTPLRTSSLPTLGLATTDHFVPFHDSTREPLAVLPTAMQLVELVQSTASRELV